MKTVDKMIVIVVLKDQWSEDNITVVRPVWRASNYTIPQRLVRLGTLEFHRV